MGYTMSEDALKLAERSLRGETQDLCREIRACWARIKEIEERAAFEVRHAELLRKQLALSKEKYSWLEVNIQRLEPVLEVHKDAAHDGDLWIIERLQAVIDAIKECQG